MADSSTIADSRRVRRLTRDDSGVVTVNLRSSRILLFWANHDTLVPIEAGWYLHAASLPRASVQGGERRLDAPIDLKDPQVRWQHAKIGRLGGTDLFLDKGRRYVFFITSQPAEQKQLVKNELPWPAQVRSAKAPGEPAVIIFQAWPYQLDDHREDREPVAAQGGNQDLSLISFDSWEHESTAEAHTRDNLSVQDMVDMWALRGLIEGGAMVDTTGDFESWKFWCPSEDPNATPQNPYGLTQLMSIDIMNATWHYIIPEKQKDPQSKTESRWTAATLKTAIRNGRAVALTIGEMIMIGGDNFALPSEMEADVLRWNNPPVNVMKVYWEARAWLQNQIKAVNGGGNVYEWAGYQHRYGAVYLVLSLLMCDPDVLANPRTVDLMEAIGGGGGDASYKIPEQQSDDSIDRNRLKSSFEGLLSRARRVDGMVDFLKTASGASRYTEIHFYAQTVGSAAQGKGGTLGWLKSRLPWLAHLDPRGDLAKAGFSGEELDWFENNGIDDQLMQIVGSNGAYGVLGLKNWTHFSYDGLNFGAFEPLHRQALALVSSHVAGPAATHPIPARALFLTSFGCHFLTDAFSAGHMRVPRKKLGAFSAKLMHDIDGLVGLWVHNNEGEPQIWYAFGDTYLHSKNISIKQRQFLPHRYGSIEVDPQINFDFAAGAVGSAIKQLHYQAYSQRQGQPLSVGPNAIIQALLDFNGPQTSGPKLEERSLDAVFDDTPPVDLPRASHLVSETLAPGKSGPERKSVAERIAMTIDQRVAFMKSLVPIPLPPSAQMPRHPYGSPSSIHDAANIPPLFNSDGKVNLGKDNPYDIVVAAGDFTGHVLRGYTDYKGFSLRVNWGPFGDFYQDEAELKLNYDKYYFMVKFFKDVHGLEDVMDKTLLDVYDKLPKEKV